MGVFNQSTDIKQVFKGVFIIFDGATEFQYDELQELVTAFTAGIEKHFSAGGKKKVVISGDDSTATITVKSTADLHDTVFPATDTKTISFFKHQMMTLRKLPLFTFEGIEESDAASNKFVHSKFDGNIIDITETRGRGAGTYETVITVEITALTTDIRNAVAPA